MRRRSSFVDRLHFPSAATTKIANATSLSSLSQSFFSLFGRASFCLHQLSQQVNNVNSNDSKKRVLLYCYCTHGAVNKHSVYIINIICPGLLFPSLCERGKSNQWVKRSNSILYIVANQSRLSLGRSGGGICIYEGEGIIKVRQREIFPQSIKNCRLLRCVRFCLNKNPRSLKDTRWKSD